MFFSQSRYAHLLSFLFGASSVLAFSPYDLWLTAPCALCGLLLITLRRSPLQAAQIGFFWGIGLFGCGVCWIYISIAQFSSFPFLANVALMAIFIAYLALFPALFSALLAAFAPQPDPIRFLLTAPVLWQSIEWLRGKLFTGFPWLQFGYTQLAGPLKGLAPIAGVSSITFILLLLSGLSALTYSHRCKWALCGILFLLGVFWPLRYLNWVQQQPERSVTIALVQGNTPQSLKWDPEQLALIVNTYMTLSSPWIKKAKWIIWPESAIPTSIQQAQPLLQQLTSRWKSGADPYLITGIVDEVSNGDYFNSIVVFNLNSSQQNRILQRYHKYHLVPFGEFIPYIHLSHLLPPLFDFPFSHFSRGEYYAPPLYINGYRLLSTICYEVILGPLLQARFDPHIDFLLTLSNDAWFNDTIGPWQHLQMARMRALELGRPLIRCTNNGVTAVVNARGEIIKQLPQFESAVLQYTLAPTRGVTPYARWGELPLQLMMIISGLAAFSLRWRALRTI